MKSYNFWFTNSGYLLEPTIRGPIEYFSEPNVSNQFR